jgi:pimeloyl-ACP methyl ester carboxylesterase
MGKGKRKLGRTAGRAAGASLLATAAGWIGYSSLMIPHRLALPPAVQGGCREITARAGRLSYYVAGEGPPLLLIHSINAAGSAYEVRPVFEHERARRRVYAVDLPGFGFSDRSPRAYAVRLYVDAVHDMLDAIAAEAGPEPVDALAVSLGSEFLARAAVERPERFRTLALVTPTGFSRASGMLRGREGSTREVPGLHGFFTFPLWSQAFYDLLVSRPSIRYFLQRTFGSKQIDEGLLDYDYLTSHQPGAKHAPYAFVSGRLFSGDIRGVYERLELPVWMPHATRGDFKDFSEAGWARARPNWTVQPFDSGALPYFERADEFLAAYDRFLEAACPAAAVSPPPPRPSRDRPGRSGAASRTGSAG